MFDKITKSAIAKIYGKLPLWGKVAAPAVAFILLMALFSIMKNVLIVGVIAVAIFAVLSLTAKMKKKN